MTPLPKEADPEMLKKWIDISAQKRIPDPSELKGLIVFMASRAVTYSTVSCILANGGFL